MTVLPPLSRQLPCLCFLFLYLCLIRSVDVHKMEASINDEMDTLISRQTWDIVLTSCGLPVVSCRWVFTIKYHPDGMVDKYKACLVARGLFRLIKWIIWWPSRLLISTLFSVLFSLTVNHQWLIFHLDVKNAFLYGDIEEVYVEQLGHVAQGENMVCKLKKTTYGLKQSPRVWFDKFNCIIAEVGFQKC